MVATGVADRVPGRLACVVYIDAFALQDPSAGQILAALSHDRVGGEAYDREWPGRAAKTMW